MDERLLQIYTGNGKGKTTAATGLILRALGYGWRVLLVRFLKTASGYGEVALLRELGVEIVDAQLGGIYDAAEAEAITADVRRMLVLTQEKLAQQYDLVVLDEFNGLFRSGYLALEEGLALLDQRPARTELVLTGRNPPQELLDRADLVTRMDLVRHPLQNGIAAREGIEF